VASPRESFWQALGIFRYLGPYRVRFGLAAAALIVSTTLGLSFPYLTGLMLDAALLTPEARAAAGWTASINAIALVLLATLAVQAVFSYFSTYGFSRSGECAVVDLRKETFSRLVGLPMTFFAQRRAGELSSRLSNDMAVIHDTLTGSAPQFIRQCTLLLGGITLVAVTSLPLTGLMLATFPFLVLVAILIGRRIRKYARRGQDFLAESNAVIEESLQGIANVKAFTAEDFERDRHAAHLGDFLNVTFNVSRLRASLISFIIFGVFGSIVAVFWHGATLMQQGEMTFGELTRFILYTMFVGGSVASFADLFGQLQRTLGATEHIRELLREIPEVPPAPAPVLRRFRGEVVFDRVEFSYPARPETPVLRGLTLEARAGQKIALVGASGAGKSTLVSLLLRFYAPTAGRITIDGTDTATLPLAELRGNMAVVPQEVLLFAGSIADNIRYGRRGASDDEVREAARRANCHQFITTFPEGFNTLVGDRGVKLSGGQRQRIAIARALLKDPAILILDEATSSLDSESEALIQEALSELLAHRTAFLIAHRLSTVRHADRICVVADGQIRESGTHDELLALPDGTYRRLCEIQFGQARDGLGPAD
jgi:ATP-binding cassette subfamily B protein